MAFTNRKNKFRPSQNQSSLDPFFGADANASINNLFNGNSLFGAPAFFDGSQPSIPLANNASASPKKEGRFKAAGPESVTLTLEYEGKEDRFIFKGQKAAYDSHNNLLLAPLINAVREQGFESRGHSVLYFASSFNAFVFVAKDPIPDSAAIALDEVDLSKPLRVKLRPTGGPESQAGPKDIIESLVAAQAGSAAKHEPESRGGSRQTRRAGPDRERQKDKEMLQNLKKTLPNTDSQNQREIDVITKPSTRAQQRSKGLPFSDDLLDFAPRFETKDRYQLRSSQHEASFPDELSVSRFAGH